MNQKQRSNKEIMLLILFIAVVGWGVLNFSTLIGFVTAFIGMLKPFVIGAAMAFVINLPLKFIEEKMLGKMPEKYKGAKRTVGIVLSLLFFAAIIYFVVISVIPQTARTVNQLAQKIPVFFNNVFQQAEILLADNPQALEFLNNLEYQSMNWNQLLNNVGNFLKSGVGSLLTSTVSVAGSLFGSVVNGIISFISSLYILSQKEKLKDQASRIVSAYFKEKAQKRIVYVFNLLYHNFSKLSIICIVFAVFIYYFYWSNYV